MQTLPRPSRHRHVRVARPGDRLPWPMIAAAVLLARPAFGEPPEIPLPRPSTPPVTAPAAKPTPTATPIERRAPTGVLFLLEDATVPLQHGLQGIAAGTEVRLVRDNGATVQISDGEHVFAVRRTQVTDDLDIAAAVQKRTAAIEAANEICRQQQEAMFVRLQQEEIEFLRTHPLASPTPTPTPTPTPKK